MKIGLINGSPKTSDSASELFLEELKLLISGNNIVNFAFHQPKIDPNQFEALSSCDVLVFAFPLYESGVPSHLLHCLSELETAFSSSKKEIKVYALVNNGFFEGDENAPAIEMMENWCKRANLQWGQGIGFGSGIIMRLMKDVKMGHGPKKNYGPALSTLSNNILEGKSGESIFVSPNLPRLVLQLEGNHYWNQLAKENGLKKKDLSIEP